MNKILIVIIPVIAIILIFLGLVVYSYTQIHVTLNDVIFESIDWETLSVKTILNLSLNLFEGNWLEAVFELIQGINLNLVFDFTNHGFIPVYIPNLSYDLAINDISIGKGNGNINTMINPGETKQIPILQNFQKNSLLPTVKSVIDTGGVIELHVNGTAYFELLGFSVPISFESTKQVSLADEISSRLDSEIQKQN